MYIPASVAWGGPGKKWIKGSDGWRECTDNPVRNDVKIQKSPKFPVIDANRGYNEKAYDTGNATYNDQGMWIRVTPKSSRERADYDCLGDFLRKLHVSKSGDKLGPFNYMLPLMELIIKKKFSSLSGTAKRFLFRVIGGMVARVLRTSEYIYELKNLLQLFQREIEKADECYVSQSIHMKDLRCVAGWIDELNHHNVPQRKDDGLSLIDMPLEVLELILSFVDEYRDIQGLSGVNDELKTLSNQTKLWKIRCRRHFYQRQIEESMKAIAGHLQEDCESSWHDIYVYAMSNFARKEQEYHSLLHCQTCGLMFWKGYGHPCLPKSSSGYDPISPEKLLHYFS